MASVARKPGLFAKGIVALIRLYQISLAWVLGGRCRFLPTCSQYGAQAVATHGAGVGLWLTTKRIARCHPWHAGGFDPVPMRKEPQP